jgi:hypothetical protein
VSEVYNAALQERRDTWQMRRVSLGYSERKAELPGVKEVRPEYKAIHSQVLQDVILRLVRAFKKFFQRAENGEKAGYPRFKNERRYHSFLLGMESVKYATCGRSPASHNQTRRMTMDIRQALSRRRRQSQVSGTRTHKTRRSPPKPYRRRCSRTF